MALVLGKEIQVNTYTAGVQNHQRILRLADGGWVVVWESVGQDGDSFGIYQQRYKADGTAVGTETLVNSHTASGQLLTLADTGSTIALANGGWVVAWTSWDQDGEYAGVYQQAYRADGTRLGSERQVNIATELSQQDPLLVPLANGGWVVYWISQEEDDTSFGTHRLYHRSFDANGAPTSGEVRIHPIHESDIGETQLRVAALDGGGWVATWVNSYRSNPYVDNDVYFEAFNASGTRIGSGRVNTATEANQTSPAVAGLEGGGWVIAWKDGTKLLQRVYHGDQGGAVETVADTGFSDARITALEGGGWVVTWQTGIAAPGLRMRAYDADGNSLGDSTVIMSSTGTQTFFETVALKGGGWVTAWVHKTNVTDIAAQVFNADGSKDGNAIYLNSTLSGGQYWVKLAALDDGGFVATWTSDGQDGDGAGVVQRIFRPKEEGQNKAPVAQDDSAAVDLYGTVQGNVISDTAGKDSDPDGDALSVTALSGGSVGTALKGRYGTLTLKADGSYSYVADRAEPLAVGAKAKDTFTYTVSDGRGGTDTATLTVTVTGVATGTAGRNHLLGSAKADALKGLGGNDILDGRAGNDTLDGGAGADTMQGGAGNDTYIVDNKADRVIEKNGEGTDLVRASVSFTLADHVEKLTLIGAKAIDGTGNGLANTLIGNGANNRLKGLAGNDVLDGGKGNDTLDGGLGADTMQGGAGNDTYIVDNKADRVIEKNGEGTDLVRASVSFTLADHVEKLTLIGAKAIDGTGNGLANTLIGNGANNRLKGLAGNDVLDGGKGNDTLDGGLGDDRLTGGAGADALTGGLGRDTFVFKSVAESTAAASGRDTIHDFARKQGDRIDLKAIDADTGKADDQPFNFVGSEKFHKKAGELRYEKKGGDTFLHGDVDGDGKADFSVLFDAAIDFVKADFIL